MSKPTGLFDGYLSNLSPPQKHLEHMGVPHMGYLGLYVLTRLAHKLYPVGFVD